MLTKSIFALIILNTTFAQKCPSSDASCTYNKSKYNLNDAKAPQCWSKNYNGWRCTPKQGSKCHGYGAIDISKCTQPKVECPKQNDICAVGMNIYPPNFAGSPQCWTKTNNTFWNCTEKLPGGQCDLNKTQIDISTCKYDTNPPIVDPLPPAECPSLNEVCNDGTNTFTIGDTFKNGKQCWARSGNQWKCTSPQNDKCNRKLGENDLRFCAWEPTPQPPETTPVVDPLPPIGCPSLNEVCIDGTDKFRIGDTFNNGKQCWFKSGEQWKCTSRQNGQCNRSLGQMDLGYCAWEPEPKSKSYSSEPSKPSYPYYG